MHEAIRIIESIPKRFRKEKAADFNCIMHFELENEEPILYTVNILNGACFLQKGLHNKPDCVISCTANDYVALETGSLQPQEALMSGKVKVSDIAVMMQFVKCFKRYDTTTASNHSFGTEESVELKYVQRPEINGPLRGVRIVDFTRLLPGPLATMFLAQLGAEVIKVEDPDNPDYVRTFHPRLHDYSAFYYALNACKKSCCINYLKPEGREILFHIISTADVLVEQFRPGVMKHFGLDYDTLSEKFPQLIYVSITGHGSHSSRKDIAGHDLNYIAESGLVHMNGNTPTLPGFQAADVAGGAYMAMHAITTALFQREKTQKGCHVNVAMTDAVLPLVALPLAAQQCIQETLKPGLFELGGSLPNYNIYRCADGKYIALGALEPKFWNNFCDAVHKQEWKQCIIGSQEEKNKVIQEVANLFLSKPRDLWLDLLKSTDCCISPVNDMQEVLSYDYYNEQNMFIENQIISGKTLKTLRHPVKFNDTESNSYWLAPYLGEDTASVLSSLGYEEKNIKDFKSKGLVK